MNPPKPTETLKPCPWCGSPGMIRGRDPHAFCSNRKCWQLSVPIQVWNTRPATMEQRALDCVKALCDHQQRISSPDTRWELPVYQNARALLREAGRVG